MSTHVSAGAVKARENARQGDGRFGEQAHGGPDPDAVTLDDDFDSDENDPRDPAGELRALVGDVIGPTGMVHRVTPDGESTWTVEVSKNGMRSTGRVRLAEGPGGQVWEPVTGSDDSARWTHDDLAGVGVARVLNANAFVAGRRDPALVRATSVKVLDDALFRDTAAERVEPRAQLCREKAALASDSLRAAISSASSGDEAQHHRLVEAARQDAAASAASDATHLAMVEDAIEMRRLPPHAASDAVRRLYGDTGVVARKWREVTADPSKGPGDAEFDEARDQWTRLVVNTTPSWRRHAASVVDGQVNDPSWAPEF